MAGPNEKNKWTRLLAYVTGLANQELLLQNEYLAAENRILRGHLDCACPIRRDPPWLKAGSDSGRKGIPSTYNPRSYSA